MAIGGYDGDLKYYEDWDFGLRLLEHRLKNDQAVGVIKLPERHYQYRQHMTGENVNARQKDHHAFFSRMVEKCPLMYGRCFDISDPGKLVDWLAENKVSPMTLTDSLVQKWTLVWQNPVWAATRILPFAGKHLSRLFSRVGFGQEKAPVVEQQELSYDSTEPR